MSHMSHTHRGMITCRSGSDEARAVAAAAAAADDDDDARRSGKTWARGGRGTKRGLEGDEPIAHAEDETTTAPKTTHSEAPVEAGADRDAT